MLVTGLYSVGKSVRSLIGSGSSIILVTGLGLYGSTVRGLISPQVDWRGSYLFRS